MSIASVFEQDCTVHLESLLKKPRNYLPGATCFLLGILAGVLIANIIVLKRKNVAD